eukprot:1361431-Amphidinium_carterae.1
MKCSPLATSSIVIREGQVKLWFFGIIRAFSWHALQLGVSNSKHVHVEKNMQQPMGGQVLHASLGRKEGESEKGSATEGAPGLEEGDCEEVAAVDST